MKYPVIVLAAWAAPLAILLSFVFGYNGGAQRLSGLVVAIGFAVLALIPGFFAGPSWVRWVSGINVFVVGFFINGCIKDYQHHNPYSGWGALILVPVLGLGVMLSIAIAIGITFEFRASGVAFKWGQLVPREAFRIACVAFALHSLSRIKGSFEALFYAGPEDIGALKISVIFYSIPALACVVSSIGLFFKSAGAVYLLLVALIAEVTLRYQDLFSFWFLRSHLPAVTMLVWSWIAVIRKE